MAVRFVLASASPARLATLRAAGVEPEVIVSGVDEDSIRATSVSSLVATLAQVKARAVAGELVRKAESAPVTVQGADAESAPAVEGVPTFVLGCDSLLELDGEPLGKPGSAEAAIARWQKMRGRTGQLHTGHALIRLDALAPLVAGATPPEPTVLVEVASTSVTFAEASDSEIADYVATGEPLNVAGAFTIDGLGGWLIESIEGDHHNVVGLSLPVLRRMLTELGSGFRELPPGLPTSMSSQISSSAAS